MRKILASLLIALACQAAADDQSAKVKRLRGQLTQFFKDPEAARFKDEFIVGEALCGKVNAKNGFGGYVGYVRFISHPRFVMSYGNEAMFSKKDKSEASRIWQEETRDKLATARQKLYEVAEQDELPEPSKSDLYASDFKVMWQSYCQK